MVGDVVELLRALREMQKSLQDPSLMYSKILSTLHIITKPTQVTPLHGVKK